METQYFKDYSPALGREMECKVYGHAGRPMLFIPCQDGRFFDFEDFHMAGTLAPWIESGQIMVISIDTIDQETWSDTNGDPYWRIRRYEQWIRYIVEEVVPKIQYIAKERNGWDGLPGVIAFGCKPGRNPCRQPLPAVPLSFRWLSGPQRHLHRKIRLWRLHGRGGLPELPRGLYGQLPHRSPLYGPLPQQEGGHLLRSGRLGAARYHPAAQARSLSRKASLSGWTCGAMMSSTTGIGGISRSCIICLIF